MTAPHLPFARRYRPQAFQELVGQPHVTETLTRALSQQRLAQAYLFAGLRGVGKTSAARILAKCLNCESGPTARPCNRCDICTGITAGASLAVTEIDGASNRGIDEIRSLRETIPFAPAGARFHVYIIDEVHMLTAEAFNALLKTLEEPPAHVKFIFATTAANKVPSTILSRCQRFDFRRLDAPTIVGALSNIVKLEQLKVEAPALYAIARAADGSLRDAEVMLEQAVSFTDGAVTESDVTELLGQVEGEALRAWTQALLDRDAPEALRQLAAQLERGKEPAPLLVSLLHYLRNLLIVSASGGDVKSVARLIDEPAERLADLVKQAQCVSAQELLLLVQILHGAYELVRRSPLAQTVLELAIIKVATREQWVAIDELTRRLEQAGQGVASSPAAAQPAATRPGAASKLTSATVPGTLQQSSGSIIATSAASEPSNPAPVVRAEAPASLAEMWSTFLEQLGAQKMSLAAYLADARPLRFEGHTLVIGLPGFALHQEVLTAVDHQRLIERLWSGLQGQAVKVAYEMMPEPEPSAVPARSASRDTGSPIVDDIVRLFNATLLAPPKATG